MNRKIYNDEKFYQKKQYIKIRNLFSERKYNSVIKEATNYLDIYPNDKNIRFMRAKSYRFLEIFDNAINDLKYNLQDKDDTYSLTELYFIYYYLNMYKEAMDLLPLLYEKRCINAYSVSISELVMKKQLGIDIRLRKDVNCDYIRTQIFNYSSYMALNHIQENHINTEEHSCFNKDIDLNYLFKTVREEVKNSKKVNTEEVLEIHYFGVSNIGYINNNICNFIKVVVIPNTNNVINIYPIFAVNCDYTSNLNCDYSKLFKKEEKVKSLSQIDKFNKRYRKV